MHAWKHKSTFNSAEFSYNNELSKKEINKNYGYSSTKNNNILKNP